MLLPRRPGISLKISAMVSLMIVGEMILLSWLLDAFGSDYSTLVVLAFVVGTLIASLALAAALDWLVTRPLQRLVRQVRGLPDKGYEIPFEPSGIDEPRELGEALEGLRQAVVSREEELQQLNQELEARVEARTEQLRRAQRQLAQAEKLASVGKLAGGVAHEINNPTGVILARSSYLVSVADEEGFDPDVIEDLEVLVQQAERIRTITGDLLSFARRSRERRGWVDLRASAQLTLKLLKHKASKAQVALALEAEEDLQLWGRRDALEQVLFNLVKNAIEATPAGGQVRLELSERPEEPRRLQILVDDNGPGVSQERRSLIFDPFFTTKALGKGTGLGLSVVYGIVQDHRGTIAVDEAPAGGARFRILFPVDAATEDGPAASPSSPDHEEA